MVGVYLKASMIGSVSLPTQPSRLAPVVENGTDFGLCFMALSTRRSSSPISLLRKSRNIGGLANSFCTFCQMRISSP